MTCEGLSPVNGSIINGFSRSFMTLTKERLRLASEGTEGCSGCMAVVGNYATLTHSDSFLYV